MAKKFDTLTVVGLAAVAYVVTTWLHEGLGHGGACLVVGGQPHAWGAYYFDCSEAPGWPTRLVAAAGSCVNLVVATILGLALKFRLRDTQTPRGAGTVFLWLMFCLNAFTWAGYFLFSGIGGIGDWGAEKEGVIFDLPNSLVLRAVMTVFGGVCYFLIGRSAGRMLGRIIGGDDKQAGRQLSLVAYTTGGILAFLIGLMNPVGFVIVLISSLASSLGGTSGLCWVHRFMLPQPEAMFGDHTKAVFVLPRNWIWILAGVIFTAAYAAIFGPSLKFA